MLLSGVQSMQTRQGHALWKDTGTETSAILRITHNSEHKSCIRIAVSVVNIQSSSLVSISVSSSIPTMQCGLRALFVCFVMHKLTSFFKLFVLISILLHFTIQNLLTHLWWFKSWIDLFSLMSKELTPSFNTKQSIIRIMTNQSMITWLYSTWSKITGTKY